MEDELLKCAFNQRANKENCVAYCKNHKCHLTIAQLKNMKCLQKQCKYLEKFLLHQFWVEREAKKKQKRLKK